MKKMFLLICSLSIIFVTAGCGMISKEKLAEDVKKSMLETWSKVPQMRDIKIDSLTIIHKSGKKYNGLLEGLKSGKKISLSVEVTCDSEKLSWRIRETAGWETIMNESLADDVK